MLIIELLVESRDRLRQHVLRPPVVFETTRRAANQDQQCTRTKPGTHRSQAVTSNSRSANHDEARFVASAYPDSPQPDDRRQITLANRSCCRSTRRTHSG